LPRPHKRGAECLLIIQQTDEIFASFPDDNAALLQRGIGVETVELAGDLRLQVAGIGRYPHRPVVLLRPQARRRDIAERLADSRPGFGEDGLGPVWLGARREGRSSGRGVIGLLRARLGGSTQ
jgi:hypothetical protein